MVNGVLVERRRLLCFIPGWRQELPGWSWGESILTPVPQEVSVITTFPGPLPERAQVLLCRQTLPQIQTPTVCSANQPRDYWWNGNQRKQMANSFIKVQKHFSWSSLSSVKAVALFKMEAASRMNSGTWVLGVTGMHHGFSSLILKAPRFYS